MIYIIVLGAIAEISVDVSCLVKR